LSYASANNKYPRLGKFLSFYFIHLLIHKKKTQNMKKLILNLLMYGQFLLYSLVIAIAYLDLKLK